MSRKRAKNTTVAVAILAFSFMFLSIMQISYADSDRKDVVMTQYDDVITLAEELGVYESDPMQILPKIRTATHALLRSDYQTAEIQLDDAMLSLRVLEHEQPTQSRMVSRLAVLEIYLDIVQKYAILALLAILAIKLPFFRSFATASSQHARHRFYCVLMVIVAAIFFSLFDLKRYGESSWLFLDYHVILIAIGGCLGGLWTAIPAALVVGCFRWIMRPEMLVAFGVPLAVAMLSTLMMPHIRRKQMWKHVLACSSFIAFFHAVIVYAPMVSTLNLSYVLLSVLFLAFAEGGAISLFLCLINNLLVMESKREIKQELLKTQLLFLQAQINPHFLYNTLNTIAAVCDQGDLKLARQLIFRLSEFFRRTMSRVEDLVTLREEMAHIDSYIEIEKARFQERLRIEKHFDISQELWNVKIPILILQPLVENAIKHGISKKKSGGTLSVSIREENGVLRVEIADDGVGIRRSQIQLEDKDAAGSNRMRGIGIQNINSRLTHLWGEKYRLQFSGEPGVGTKVVVPIPIQSKGGYTACAA